MHFGSTLFSKQNTTTLMASDQKQETNFVRPDNEPHVSAEQHVCSSVLYALVYCKLSYIYAYMHV